MDDADREAGAMDGHDSCMAHRDGLRFALARWAVVGGGGRHTRKNKKPPLAHNHACLERVAFFGRVEVLVSIGRRPFVLDHI